MPSSPPERRRPLATAYEPPRLTVLGSAYALTTVDPHQQLPAPLGTHQFSHSG